MDQTIENNNHRGDNRGKNSRADEASSKGLSLQENGQYQRKHHLNWHFEYDKKGCYLQRFPEDGIAHHIDIVLDAIEIAVSPQQTVLPQASLQSRKNRQVTEDEKIDDSRQNEEKSHKIVLIFFCWSFSAKNSPQAAWEPLLYLPYIHPFVVTTLVVDKIVKQRPKSLLQNIKSIITMLTRFPR